MSAYGGKKKKNTDGAEERLRGIRGRMSMRDAVVMSEILSPPVSVRKTRPAGRGGA